MHQIEYIHLFKARAAAAKPLSLNVNTSLIYSIYIKFRELAVLAFHHFVVFIIFCFLSSRMLHLCR